MERMALQAKGSTRQHSLQQYSICSDRPKNYYMILSRFLRQDPSRLYNNATISTKTLNADIGSTP